jgi:hypothetical protein
MKEEEKCCLKTEGEFSLCFNFSGSEEMLIGTFQSEFLTQGCSPFFYPLPFNFIKHIAITKD